MWLICGCFFLRALGLGNTRGRIYLKHPDIFKVNTSSDSSKLGHAFSCSHCLSATHCMHFMVSGFWPILLGVPVSDRCINAILGIVLLQFHQVLDRQLRNLIQNLIQNLQIRGKMCISVSTQSHYVITLWSMIWY